MKQLLICLFVLFSLHSKADVQISLLTTTPGNQAHTIFGHSAFRVVDEDNHFDKIYNYGLFDFKTPFFPLKFLKGDLEYWLGTQTLRKFGAINNREKRFINEQVLDLSQLQAERIFSALLSNAESENKFYRYSFTQRNCSTEIRDILYQYQLIGGRLETTQSYRDLMNEYMRPHNWLKLGMNMIMGMEVDKQMSFEQQLFIPDKLYEAVASAPHLVKENKVLNNFQPYVPSPVFQFFTSPWFVFSSLLLISLFWCPKWLQLSLFLVVGLLGIVSALIWMLTLHPELTNNLNVLWCNPLYLAFVPMILMKKRWKYLIYACLGCLALVPIIWLFQIQSFDHQIIPIVLILVALNIQQLKQNQRKLWAQT